MLGHNSYGLWEGTIGGNVPQLFRIYVMSPTITLVLKQNVTKNPIFQMMEDSTLSGIPLKPATTKYQRPPPQLRDRTVDEWQMYLALQQHLKSSFSGEDEFSFDINRLSADQTYLVNQVVLENLHTNGSLVFRSKNAMLATASRYDTPEGPFRKRNRPAIAALAACLGSPNPGSTSPPIRNEGAPAPPMESPGIRRSLLLNRAAIERLGLDMSEFDLAFDDMLIDVLEGSIEFKNGFSRARYIHGILPHPDFSSHPFVIHVFRKLARMFKYIEVMQAGVGLSNLPKGTPKYELVEALQDDDACYLLNLVSSHIERWEKDWHLTEDEGVKDEGFKMLEQVIAVAYLDVLLDVDHRLATEICGSVPFMRRAPPREDTPPPHRPVKTEAGRSSCGNVGPMKDVHRRQPKGEPTSCLEGDGRGTRDTSAVSLPQVPTGLSEREPWGPGQNPEPPLPQAFIEEIEDAPLERPAGTEMRKEAVEVTRSLSGEKSTGEPTSYDIMFGSPGDGKRAMPRRRIISFIPWMLLACLAHLGAGVLSLFIELAIELWAGCRGGAPRERANEPHPDQTTFFPSFVGHFFMAGFSFYAAVYMVAAVLFDLPVYE